MKDEDKNLQLLEGLTKPQYVKDLLQNASDGDDAEHLIRVVNDAFYPEMFAPMIQEFWASYCELLRNFPEKDRDKPEQFIATYQDQLRLITDTYKKTLQSVAPVLGPIMAAPMPMAAIPIPLGGKEEKKQAAAVPPKKPILLNDRDTEIQCEVEYIFKSWDPENNPQDAKLHSLINTYVNTYMTGRVLRFVNRDYRVVDEVHITDTLGEWKFDHLWSMMWIYLRFTQPPPKLPGEFEIKKDSLKIVYKRLDPKQLKAKLDYPKELTMFLNNVEKRTEKAGLAARFMEVFAKEHVDNLDELLKWSEDDWKNVRGVAVNDAKILRDALNKYKFRRAGEDKKESSKAEELATKHKILRYFTSEVEPELLAEIPDLDLEAIETAFQEIDYSGDELLGQLTDFYTAYAIPASYSKDLKNSRGMILYGPPGTGKTTLTDKLPLILGLCPLTYALCASEVNRSLVGQTEQLLKDLFNRGNKMPYLRCCVAIDEIDGLAPKRDEKSSQHKTDALAVLLSMIEGIQDVKNVIVLASTNRLDSIDDALRRRLSGQFFVGRPGPDARRKMIRKVDKLNMTEEEVEELVNSTTNFSGAAMKSLTSAIVRAKYSGPGKPPKKIDESRIHQLISQISKQFNVKLGCSTLIDLQLELGPKRKTLWDPEVKYELLPGNSKYLTGRIFIDMEFKEQQIEFECLGRPEGNPLVQKFELKENLRMNTNMILPFMADFATFRNIDFVSFLDMDLLLSNNAFEESKIMESIKEKRQEVVGAYKKSLYIIDVDSLAGVTESESLSNMGISTNRSISSIKLLTYIFEEAVKLPQIKKDGTEVWVAVISRQPFVSKLLKKNIGWPPSAKYKRKQAEEEKLKEVRRCLRCDEDYTEDKNELTSCTYHPYQLYESSLPPRYWAEVSKQEAEMKTAKMRSEKMDEPVFQYLCCNRRINEPGCKKAKHTTGGAEWDKEQHKREQEEPEKLIQISLQAEQIK